MQTVITTSPAEAAAILTRGGLVAFPTETVYGLGADAFNEDAVAKIFVAKMRPSDNPLIAHIGRPDQINELAAEVTESAKLLIGEFFPGPLTIVLRRSKRVPDVATAGLDTIGIRMPAASTAKEFLIACGTPVVAPSANLSGRPSPTTFEAVLEDLDGRIACILKSDATDIGIESTVVDCTGDVPLLLRRGSISLEQLRSIVATTAAAADDDMIASRSPGTRHRHYSPRARVKILTAEANIENYLYSGGRFAYIGFRLVDEGFVFAKTCSNMVEYAHELFEFFRECDRHGIEEIYCDAVPEHGLGAALMDRLRRAAED